MSTILEEIYTTDKYICDHISKASNTERGLVSQSIIAVLRNFVEHIALYEYSIDNKEDLENNWESISNKAIPYLDQCGHLSFLKEFLDLLKISVSHYTPDRDHSERLMLKYYEYLFRTRKYLSKKRKISVLKNLETFPLNLDKGLSEYYEKISEIINTINDSNKTGFNSFYILKKKAFYVKKEMFFEITLTLADDYSSKSDRIIVYTKDDIPQNYAISAIFTYDYIDIFGMKFPITIINDWKIAIRPCELNNFCRFFGLDTSIQKGYFEYKNLMVFLKESGFTLDDLVKMPNYYYEKYKNEILKGAKRESFFPAIAATRMLYQNKSAGSNVLLYLLHRLNNVVLKKQFKTEKENSLSDLFLSMKCKPFDDLPFNTALINHIPKFMDLVKSIGVKGHEDELLARHIYNNIEQKGILYTSIKELCTDVNNLDELISSYNDKLYIGHRQARTLVKENGNLYIKGYENDTITIINKIITHSSEGISDYSNFAEEWLIRGESNVDDPDKVSIIKDIFSTTRVALIYGSAGTGKSTLIDHISNLFADSKKVFIANTNPAVDNLRSRVKAPNSSFMTITKYLYSESERNCDILVIDECSTVSNTNMLKILNTSYFTLLVLVGDIYQIESISFGNWFRLCRYFVNKSAIFELKKPYRASDRNLLNLWESVRNLSNDIEEKLEKGNFCSKLDKSLFMEKEEREIILCLNYDGLYGINNINKMLQISNPNSAVRIGVLDYKVDDPILFNENSRFRPVLYNNLSGRITKIVETEKFYYFEILVDRVIPEMEVVSLPIDIINSTIPEKTKIGITIYKFEGDSDSEDREESTIIPFQIAYAISIHKSQGLEFNSVKIIVTNEVDEMITHNIFYTAITRAREKLKIYWSPESQKKILDSFSDLKDKDHYILSNKFNLKINKPDC